jgi:hypothetical protein
MTNRSQRLGRLAALVLAAALILGGSWAAFAGSHSRGIGVSARPSASATHTSASPSGVVTPGTGNPGTGNPGTANPGATASASVAAVGSAGQNALALAGSAPTSAEFTAASAQWRLQLSYDCSATGSTFQLTVADPAGKSIATRNYLGKSAEAITLPGPGAFALRIDGTCQWTLSATG